jgi:CPA2 family monovalent cation:H+ antiporter-2
MHLDPIMPYLVGAALTIVLVGLLLRHLRQPHVVAYLLTGIALGPHGFALITEESTLSHLGSLGVVLLLFFVGMEVSPKRLIDNWKVALIGTLLQILLSVAAVWIIGQFAAWPLARTLLIGFVISLSSTAVVLKILQERGELESDTGQDVLGILLVQDLAVIPMLLILGTFSGEGSSVIQIVLQAAGTILFIGLISLIVTRDSIHLPLGKLLGDDHEMQVFAALSTALGAFVGGMLISAARETSWVHHNVEPFRVVFVALFFVSIGMLVDLRFFAQHWQQVMLLLAAVLLINTFINAAILRLLGEAWKDSLYAGALLSQIGEFSFVLAAIGMQGNIISQYGYQLTIVTIALSLLISPAWIELNKRLLHR